MADGRDESQDREPLSWRVRRWAAPIAMAASVVASISAVQLLVDDDVRYAVPHLDDRRPRFMLTTGRMADTWPHDGPVPWFQVRALQQDGRTRQVDSVRPPSPSAGEAREILAGPKGTFVITAFRNKPCESRLYRFRLTDDGHVRDIEPLHMETVPALVAGLAMSPDGDRLAYTTAPCATDIRRPAEPRATVTVLDLDSGDRRTWATAAPSVIGEIVWARDGRTLGYTVSDVQPGASPGPDVRPGQLHAPVERAVQNVTMHALDTDAQGSDLRAGRVLL